MCVFFLQTEERDGAVSAMSSEITKSDVDESVDDSQNTLSSKVMQSSDSTPRQVKVREEC